MTGLIDWLTAQMAANPLLVATIVGALATIESLLVVGGLIPGTTVILAIAAAAGAVEHALTPLFVAASVGAILGDGVSYWVGRRYGEQIVAWGPIARRPKLLGAAEDYFRRNGTMSIFAARFLPGLRSFVPVSAGILGMSPARFGAANVTSAVIWAALHIYGAGLAGGVLADLGGRLAAILVGLVVALGLAVWLARRIAFATVPLVVRARDAAHRWFAARRDPASRLVARTLAPDDPTGLLTLLWTGLLVAALLMFFGLLEDVHEGDPLVQTDLAVSRFIQTMRTPALDHAMVAVTMLGDAVVLAGVALAVVAWLLVRRCFGIAAAFAAATLLPLGFVPLVKSALERARPLSDLYAGAENFSFPSGHATNSAVLLTLLAVLIGGALRGVWRWAVVAALAAAALAIGFSRVYLQAHWPSDVVAGLAFAAAVAATFLLVLGRMPAEKIGLRGIAAVALGAYLAIGGVHIWRDTDAARIAYRPRDMSVALADWRGASWRTVEPGRIGFRGEVEAPFVLQWAGAQDPLQRVLEGQGWEPAPAWSVAALGGIVSPATPIEAIPPLPQYHLGRPAEVWVKPQQAGDARLVFRLWPTQYTVAGETLFVGAVDGERLDHPFGLFSLVDDVPGGAAAAADLTAALAGDAAAAGSALLIGDAGPR